MFLLHDGDEGYADELAGFLATQGIPVSTSLRDSRAVVVVSSGAARGATRLRAELAQAISRGLWIFPLLRGGSLPAQIADLPYEDVGDGRMPRAGLVAALQRLINTPDPHPAPVADASVIGTPQHRRRLVLIAAATIAALVLGTAVLALLSENRRHFEPAQTVTTPGRGGP